MSANPTEEWVQKAEDNYISALALMRQRKNRVFDVVCNQCQQSAEKYLKALLLRHQAGFPKTHDMKQLLDLVAHAEPEVRLFREQILSLDPYGVDIRYPGLQATVGEAKEAIMAMKKVRRFVRARLGLKPK